MIPEALGHFRHSGLIDDEGSTTWDEESINKAIELFKPLIKEVDPIGVYLRLGEDREVEEEDKFGEDIGLLDTLYMQIFIIGDFYREAEVSKKFFKLEHQWRRQNLGDKQYINPDVYALPHRTSYGPPLQTLDEARHLFHISPITHQRIDLLLE